MTTKHTPGPWFVDRELGRTTISGAGFRQMAVFTVRRSFREDFEESEANAHVAALAPEMLDALETLLKLSERSDAEDRAAIFASEGEPMCHVRSLIAKVKAGAR